MTICIAALADKGTKLVIAADQMITASIPMSYEFETDEVQKIYQITDKGFVLTAGNALYADEIIKETCKRIDGDQTNQTTEGIAEIVREEFVKYRHKIITRNVLEPRGITLANYYDLQQKLVPGVVGEIENNLTNFDIGVELIIAGQNDNQECHIFTVTHPGQLLNHDPIGFVCVGSGAPHAMYYLIGSNYRKSIPLDDVKKLVGQAKEKSEVAPGVGKATTIKVLSDEKGEEKNATKK